LAEEHSLTVVDNFTANVQVGSKVVGVGMWDTAGREEFDRLRPLSYTNAQVFLLCFSVVNPAHFDSIAQKWHQEVKHFCPDCPIILVGTKQDLRNDAATLSELASAGQVPISTEKGKLLAEKIEAVSYMECSALSRFGLKEVFDSAIGAVLFRSAKPKRSFFKALLGHEEKINIESIGAPQDFRHDAHLGWDSQNGFDIRRIPPEWKGLFKAAGFQKDAQAEPQKVAVVQEHSGKLAKAEAKKSQPVGRAKTDEEWLAEAIRIVSAMAQKAQQEGNANKARDYDASLKSLNKLQTALTKGDQAQLAQVRTEIQQIRASFK
jgi:small GTP-binding protein